MPGHFVTVSKHDHGFYGSLCAAALPICVVTSVAKRRQFRSLMRGSLHAPRSAISSDKSTRSILTTPTTRTTTSVADRPDETLAATETNRLLREAVADLPTHERLPICLHYLEGLNTEEVADALERPIKTVRSQLSRGLQRLRRKVTGRGLGLSLSALPGALAALEHDSAPATWYPFAAYEPMAQHTFTTTVSEVSDITSSSAITTPSSAISGTLPFLGQAQR